MLSSREKGAGVWASSYGRAGQSAYQRLSMPIHSQPARHPSLRGQTTGSFVTLDAALALRSAAIAAEAGATSETNLALLWHQLVHGHFSVLDDFFSEERHYLLLAPGPPGQGSASLLEGRRLEILVAVLGGLRQKNVAIDLGLAPSTVALNSRLALQALGVGCRPSRAHPLLMLAASASQQAVRVVATEASFVARDGRELRVIGGPRPDRRLVDLLPAAELAVIRALIEGHSYEEIAAQRATSVRTIANQVTAVFRRLRVSGRNELVQRLFFDQDLEAEAPRRDSLIPRAAEPALPPGWDVTQHTA